MTNGRDPSAGATGERALREDIVTALRRVLPAEPGIAVIHSSFPLLVPPRGFVPEDALHALDELVRSGWTVALPAFTFSFCGTGRFDVAGKSETGLFADWLRVHRPDAVRTRHPIYSFVALGPKAAEIAACPSTTTFGDDSPFGLFEREGARIAMLGCGWEYCTQIHRYEEMARVPYRHYKTFSGEVDYGDGPQHVDAQMFVRDLEIDAINDLTAIMQTLREQGAIVSEPLFRGDVEALAVSALAAAATDALAANPYILLGDGKRVERALAARASRASEAAAAIHPVRSVEGQSRPSTLEKADAGMSEGEEMHAFAKALFPICRSLTGDGTRRTLSMIRDHLPEMRIHEVASGTQVFDWTVPDEWNIRDARLIGPGGETIANFAWNNLHVVGYSEPVDIELTLDALQPHLHSLPSQPDAIPYVTSYYRRYWGFCLPHRMRAGLQPGTYRAIIDSTLAPGSLSYGELLLPGDSPEEIFLSTYVCHPSMANNELSGPLVTTWLAKWLATQSRRYSYRIIFIPETIGSITYLSRNLAEMKARMIAGFNISCIGDERAYSYLPSRAGDTLADRVVQHVLGHIDPDYVRYTFLDRGSDERQYCAPGVDLPVASLMRSKYGEYPEYHTSLDDLELVTANGLAGGLAALRQCIQLLEANRRWRVTVLGEPQLGKRGLYPDVSIVGGAHPVQTMMDMIAYSDGTRDIIEVAERIGVPAVELLPICAKLSNHGLLEATDETHPPKGINS